MSPNAPMRLVLSRRAAADLEEIGDYIAQDNPLRATTFVEELASHCERLTRYPDIGTARPELGEGLRVMPHGRYLIFYRPRDGALRIERILHSARDVTGDAFGAA